MPSKKRSETDIIKAIQAAFRPLQDTERLEVMSLYAGGPQSAAVFVRPADIRYVVRHYNKVKVVTDHGEYFLDGGIMDATRMVKPWPFLLRTHLRYIVNIDRVDRIVWAPQDIGDTIEEYQNLTREQMRK